MFWSYSAFFYVRRYFLSIFVTFRGFVPVDDFISTFCPSRRFSIWSFVPYGVIFLQCLVLRCFYHLGFWLWCFVVNLRRERSMFFSSVHRMPWKWFHRFIFISVLSWTEFAVFSFSVSFFSITRYTASIFFFVLFSAQPNTHFSSSSFGYYTTVKCTFLYFLFLWLSCTTKCTLFCFMLLQLNPGHFPLFLILFCPQPNQRHFYLCFP